MTNSSHSSAADLLAEEETLRLDQVDEAVAYRIGSHIAGAGGAARRVAFGKGGAMSSPALKGASSLETNLAILELIRSSGVVSRTELVDRSGLTGASRGPDPSLRTR